MKKAFLVLTVVVLSVGLVGIAGANVLVNPGFESGSTGWSLGGSATIGSTPGVAHSGTNYGQVATGLEGNFYQGFTLPAGTTTIEFGAYLMLTANQLSGNFDQAQIYLGITGDGGKTIGGSIANFDSSLFHAGGAGYQTDWFLVSSTLDVTGLTGAINISLINYSTPNTGFRVDDAFVNPVPEPSTLLLLGSGLLGLVGYGRKRMKK